MNIHFKFSLKFCFKLIHIWNTSKWLMNYCDRDTGLLKYDIIEGCWNFLVIKFIIYLLFLILKTWGGHHKFVFLGKTFWVCQASPMLYSKLCLPFFFFTFFLWFFFIIKVIGFFIPNFFTKKHWFSLKCYINISRRGFKQYSVLLSNVHFRLWDK